MTALGLTWDHPRGYNALAAAARRVNDGRQDPLIAWVTQPLEGFESAPITELAAAYDLIVLDHPHIGEAVAEACLTPLQDLFSSEQLDQWAAQSIGPSFQSYAWGGRNWALPLDVATQVMVHRPDRLQRPDSWSEIEEMATRLPVALSLGGPHAFLNLISMAGAEGSVLGGDRMLPDDVALPLIARMRRLAAMAPKGMSELNPIQLLEIARDTDEIALIPLVFGYVTYAQGDRPLSFTDTLRIAGRRGGVLGGTGIAFSKRTEPSAEVLAHIAWLMDERTQRGFIPTHDGQPSARAAWYDPAVNAASGHFYEQTAATAENAVLRPRFDGFPAFTLLASAALREGLAENLNETRIFETLRALWRESRDAARGDLDDNRG